MARKPFPRSQRYDTLLSDCFLISKEELEQKRIDQTLWCLLFFVLGAIVGAATEVIAYLLYYNG